MHLGFTEILAIVLIVLLLFGPGRIEKLASEMGKGIRSFREGLQGDKDKKEEDGDTKQPARKKARKKSK
jgi:sec-independent protein translocase protein TatA